MQGHGGTGAQALLLRPATDDDVDAVAALWHRAWGDGHLGTVPDALLPFRTFDHFRARVPPRIPQTRVALLDSALAGFVTVREDEIEELFVAAEARGGRVAPALLRHGEELIARRFPTAWLAVATGNARARRFYERNGWSDAGPLAYEAEIPGGTLAVPCRRYERRVVP